jgi:guanylate kinase
MTDNSLSFDFYNPQPLLIVISGTSGVGKDAVIHELKTRNLPLHFVVTATTREIRIGEVDGRDYFFYTEEEFMRRVENGEFAEWSWVYKDLKGVPHSQVEGAMQSGKDVIIKVDVQGAEKLKAIYPQAVLIFIIPTSTEEWKTRLISRKSETEASLKLRIQTALHEVTRIGAFDYVVVNGENQLCKAADDVLNIIAAEHHRVNHRKILQ